jgi:hypothetical protein
MRKKDEARASQPRFVSPMATTHVMLVQQYRFDMSWQLDPSGGTITSNYGASHGLEIILTSRLEVGLSNQPIWCTNRTSPMDLEIFPSRRNTGRCLSGRMIKNNWLDTHL